MIWYSFGRSIVTLHTHMYIQFVLETNYHKFVHVPSWILLVNKLNTSVVQNGSRLLEIDSLVYLTEMSHYLTKIQ